MSAKLAEPQDGECEAEEARASQLGELIRDLRRARGTTLQELAKKIGKSVGYMNQIERNNSTLSIAPL
jgi:ribosome-binding protein aMBF1 (putative translation factor)